MRNRRGDGPAVSNLLVTTDSGLTDAELKQRLLRLAAERGKAYGIIVRHIANPDLGAVDDPLAFMAEMSAEASGATRLAVTLAFKLFPDGHEELIRNADVSDFTIATFKQIVAASQSQTVYTAPFEGGRLLLRYSGTEPLARVMIEGQSQTEIEALAEGLAAVIHRSLGEG